MADTIASPPAVTEMAPDPHPSDNPMLRQNPAMDESFSDLDAFAVSPQDAEKPADQQPPAPVRGADGKFQKAGPKAPDTTPAKPVEKPAEKAVEQPQPKPDEKAIEKTPDKTPDRTPDRTPVSAPELRKAYETVKAENAKLKKDVETFKTAKPTEDPEKKQMAEKLSAAEKRLAQLDDTLRFSNYERSDEYKTKYLQPFHEVYTAGRKKVASLDVVERSAEDTDPETGDIRKRIVQKARPATEADFDQLVAIPDDRQARQFAKQMFGEDFAIAMQHREKVHEANAVREHALEDFQKNGAEREKQQAEMTSKQRAEMNAIWENSNKSAVEKFPALYGPTEGDDEGNALLEKGYALADKAFGDTSKIPPADLVRLHAQIRNRAAAFGRQVYVNSKLKAQVAELEKRLKEIEESAPAGGDGGSPRKDDGMDGFGIGALDKYSHSM